MHWYRITFRGDASEQLQVAEKFLDVLMSRSPNSSPATLWGQRSGVPKGEAWYFLEAEGPEFRPFIDDLDARECGMPDLTLLEPVAGSAKR